MQFIRKSICNAILSVALLTSSIAAGGGIVLSTATVAEAAVVRSISVRGNQRVDAETVRSYVSVKPGRSFSSFEIDESLKQLFATGMFADVQVFRSGSTLVVKVVENPTVNEVIFKGNKRLKDNRLKAISQLSGRSIFTDGKLQSDVARIKEAYRRTGRSAAKVDGRVVELANNRINVVFDIVEGNRTKIADINFVGNNAYSDRRLTDVLSINETNILSWLRKDDIYDPDKMSADEGRLSRFYFNHGFADFQVVSTDAVLDEATNKYTITITVEEGDRYRFGEITIESSLPDVEAEKLYRELKTKKGDVYSARRVEKTLVGLTTRIAGDGNAFAEVSPRGDRNFDDRTISIAYYVDEGPRVYIEAIEVRGNTRTRDYVIRREFDVSEGDAYNRVLIQRAKQRLDRLGFFEKVNITTGAGSSADRIIIFVDVEDKPTGEFSIGGGYSTDAGAIAEISFSEKNFLGRGQFIKVSAGAGDGSQKYALSFTEPYFLGRRLAAGFDLSRSTVDGNNSIFYDTETTLFRLRVAAPITDNLAVSAAYQFRQQAYSSDAAPGTLSPITTSIVNSGNRITSSLMYGLIYDTIDNRKVPREGIHIRFDQEFAGLGGDAQFIKTTARASAYYTLSDEADLVGMIAFGGGHVVGINQDLFVTDNFFQGGETIRGFARNGIGPRDLVNGETLGGTTYFNATAEVQFPLPVVARSMGLRGAFFVEGGTLFGNDYSGPLSGTAAQQAASRATMDSIDFRASVGASVIWDSPFGPLRVDLSHVLMKESYDRTEMFRFGISTKF
jgi:outer membrane protein insertion porin family